MKRMTFTKHICASVVFSALAVSSVHAQDSGDNSVIQGWSGTATLGATSLSGNTEASSVNAGIRLGKTVGKWEHLVFGAYFKGDATARVEATNPDGTPQEITVGGQQVQVFTLEKTGNSDRLAVGYQPRFYWRPRTYFFGIIDYEKDKPANIKLAARQVVGVGHKFFSNASGFLSAEAGFGNKTTEVVLGDDASGGVAYLGANYLNRINDNVTFNADFRADLGGDNTYTELGLGLAFKLSERMALKLSHQTRGNSDITDPTLLGASKSDNVTTVNLVVDI